MGMAITFRNKHWQSPFRKALLNLISIPQGNELFLLYGYVSEKTLKDENGNPDIELVKAIHNGMPKGGTVYIFSGRFLSKGCKYYGKSDLWWEHELINFSNRLQSELSSLNSNIVVKWTNYHEEMMKKPQWDESSAPHWHAKIAVKTLHTKDVIGAIFGSSNLTSTTFIEYSNSSNKWNAELDVVYWDSSYDSYMQEFNKISITNTDNQTGGDLNILPISVNGGNDQVKKWLLERAYKIKNNFFKP